MKQIIDAICSKGLPLRDIQNANRVNLLALLWALSLGGTSFLAHQGYLASIWVLASSFILHGVIGIWMLLAFKRFLRQLDEMERKIQLDALALAVGVSIIGFSLYSILDMADLLPDLKAAYLVVLLSLTYMLGIIFGRLSYR
ncbi:hypothetical protein L1D32_12130 [Shewanella insulae]|uniref:hypothetical protein n=1 Tax=Shewanella insulae TaxID=2681496 RepID=UPI001EFE6C33|nr:hypothetical protein [Shewanella insulae]MCG9738910.1 hypothetical protein [Shewanella insulae]